MENPIIANSDETKAMEARYQRAQTLMQGVWSQELVQNDSLFPHWIEGVDCFWYERSYKVGKNPPVKIGKEYRLVNASTGANEAAFDHASLALALSSAVNEKVDAEFLPIQKVSIFLSPLTIEFTAFSRKWEFKASHGSCIQKGDNTAPDNSNVSPDGRLAAFEREYNLWLSDLLTGEEYALTSDGAEYFVYGAPSTAWGASIDSELQVCWSPDSKKLISVQRDTREVKSTPVVHHVPVDGSLRPIIEEVRVAFPCDEHVEDYRVVVIDVNNGDVIETSYGHILSCTNGGSLFNGDMVWWSNDNKTVYFIDLVRGNQIARLVEFNTDTGLTRVLFEEFSNTFINIATHVEDYPAYRYLSATNELIWTSERSGWRHLYLYDLNSGVLKSQITQGNWPVRDVLYVDEDRREVFIHTSGRVAGRDPYYRDICRVQIDSGRIETLCTSDDEYLVHTQNSNYLFFAKILGWDIDNQTVGVAPSGNYIVTTRSRADCAPVSFLIDRAGEKTLELEAADVSGLPSGWRWPEPFQFRAADGETDLYGLMFKPSDFSHTKNYPVINCVMSSPLLPAVHKGSFFNGKPYAGWFYLQAAALAELGFIVVTMDSRGTPFRSKAFQDHSYGWIASACDTEDHLAGIRQLAQSYPCMDLNRVGLYGPSGYQGSIHNLLDSANFYSVGVFYLLQDTRLMPAALIGDQCEGLEMEHTDRLYPEELVDRYNGKLLLTHAMLDHDHLPANTFRLIEALQKANKDFDLLMLPCLGHGFSAYQIRRSWDYFVRHLSGAEPVKDFRLTVNF